ncbi:MAG: chemotaxis protein CheW [Methanoregula sp.]|jgi:chemotaxis signal transduction protein|uniref:chemotaxis protein CheW n=1 Tax=Methanoregula sp. TaxID=2052170 RepID=UPI0025E26F13|nr:chemotaxis protein CheW [Methanoregula sp.]MCK9632621.1 chemotaxis protein CheW [Methanoregula sp.]
MVQLLLFSIEKILGAIPLADTSHVIRMVRLKKKPFAPPWEAGTINHHGKEITVISMRALLGVTVVSPRLTDMLIIAHAGSREIALWVDATSGVQEISLSYESLVSTASNQSEIPGVKLTADGIHIIYDLSSMIAAGARVPDHSVIQGAYERDGACDPDEKPGPGEFTGASLIDSLLDERAKKIAQPEEGLSETEIIEILKFRLAYREYAIEMQHIREVILTGEITPVPGTPEYISGICVVRGEIISLVDLRVLLAIPEKGLTDLNRVIVLTDHKLSFGILADHITGIGTIELDRIEPTDPGAAVRSDYVKGVAGGSLIVLDTAAIFADPKMIIEDT